MSAGYLIINRENHVPHFREIMPVDFRFQPLELFVAWLDMFMKIGRLRYEGWCLHIFQHSPKGAYPGFFEIRLKELPI